MKKIICLAVCSLLFAAAYGQQSPRLVVRGDDMGYTHSGNEAIIKCYKEGVETSVEVLVPSPWFMEAVKMLKENPGIDVGIHLALTSEWENIKWRPLSDCPSLKDANGYFYPMVHPNKDYPGQSIMENKWTIADVEKEFRAQIEMALKLLPRTSHISTHMGCDGLNDEVKALVKRLAKEYHIAPPAEYNANTISIGFGGSGKTTEQKVQSFLDIISNMLPGKTYILVDHPGLDNDELRAVYHIGNTDVAIARQAVTDVFTNEKVKALIKQKGVQLISLKDFWE